MPAVADEERVTAAARAAIVTGASSGIGLAIATVLCEEGCSVTIVARRAERLRAAAETLSARGFDVHCVPGDMSREEDIEKVVAAHAARYGRLDVLVNNAGVGVGALLGDIQPKHIDLQLQLNVRSTILVYQKCESMLRAAGAEHRNALVVNVASILGKHSEAWLSVYSSTKHAIVGWTEAMNRELLPAGIKSTVLCPGWVDTPMASFMKDHVAPGGMISSGDVAEAVRFLLKLSPAAVIGEIVIGLELQARPPGIVDAPPPE